MIIALLGLALVAGGASPAPPPTSLPNVLVLFADDLGLNEILIPHAPYGYTGINGTIKTPALAQLADEGMLFMHWYSAFHVCSPSRAALQTGRLPLRLGIDTGVLTSEAKGGLQTNETTLAEMMKERGYATAMAGKWHLGQREEYLPHSRGYDRYFGIPYSCDMGESAWGAKHRQDPFQSVPLPLLNNTAGHRTVVAEQPADLRTLSSRYAAFGASFIKEQAAAKQPWFLFMSWNHVHTPQFANPQFCQSSPRGPLGDSVQEMDAAVGTVMAAVKAAGADDNTIVFFTSDNGAPTSGDVYGNLPLLGFKTTTWEGGIRMPAIARWPGRIKAKSVTYELAATYDIYPTVRNLVHGGSPSSKGDGGPALDGRDLAPVIFGQGGGKSGHDCLFHWHNGMEQAGLYAVRCGDYKVHYTTAGPQACSDKHGTGNCDTKDADVPWPTKSTVWDPPLIFNLKEDPSERKRLKPNTPEYAAANSTAAKARAAHLAGLVKVCTQMSSAKGGCGGNDYQYAICSDPHSNVTDPAHPVCTITPAAWAKPQCY